MEALSGLVGLQLPDLMVSVDLLTQSLIQGELSVDAVEERSRLIGSFHLLFTSCLQTVLLLLQKLL